MLAKVVFLISFVGLKINILYSLALLSKSMIFLSLPPRPSLSPPPSPNTGQRPAAIVSPLAGTTRDVLESALDIHGYPIVIRCVHLLMILLKMQFLIVSLNCAVIPLD